MKFFYLHWDCNINFQLTKKVPVVLHNLKGYDRHLIFSELDKFDVKVNVIPNGLEKYMAFFLGRNLVFIDSMQFMNSSLDKIVINLLDEDFKYSVEGFGSENLEILKQKGAYPYEYMNSFKRFNEEKVDVFEKLIVTCLKYYGLDPCHYFSSPGLSWDAMLKMTGVKLEKISDIDKYLFIEKGSRGGISYIAKRYAKANNKYMNDYDPEKPQN